MSTSGNAPISPISCPSGGSLQDGKCISPQVCPIGTTLNPSSGKCDGEPTPICVNDTVYNSNAGGCVTKPKCTGNTVWDTVTNRCSGVASQYCPVGNLVSNNMCQTNAIVGPCPIGRLSYNNKCYTCPTGFAFVKETGTNKYMCGVNRPYDSVTNTYSQCVVGVSQSDTDICWGPEISY